MIGKIISHYLIAADKIIENLNVYYEYKNWGINLTLSYS